MHGRDAHGSTWGTSNSAPRGGSASPPHPSSPADPRRAVPGHRLPRRLRPRMEARQGVGEGRGEVEEAGADSLDERSARIALDEPRGRPQGRAARGNEAGRAFASPRTCGERRCPSSSPSSTTCSQSVERGRVETVDSSSRTTLLPPPSCRDSVKPVASPAKWQERPAGEVTQRGRQVHERERPCAGDSRPSWRIAGRLPPLGERPTLR